VHGIHGNPRNPRHRHHPSSSSIAVRRHRRHRRHRHRRRRRLSSVVCCRLYGLTLMPPTHTTHGMPPPGGGFLAYGPVPPTPNAADPQAWLSKPCLACHGHRGYGRHWAAVSRPHALRHRDLVLIGVIEAHAAERRRVGAALGCSAHSAGPYGQAHAADPRNSSSSSSNSSSSSSSSSVPPTHPPGPRATGLGGYNIREYRPCMDGIPCRKQGTPSKGCSVPISLPLTPTRAMQRPTNPSSP